MPAAKKVLAVCVNWNGRKVLPATLSSLANSHYPALEVMVVDNASEDGSVKLVPDSTRLLVLPRNSGYGAGLNAAVHPYVEATGRLPDAHPDFFLFLNNDIVLEPDLIDRLVRFAEDKDPAIYGPKILLQQKPSRLDAAWGRLTWSHVLARYRGKQAPDAPRWNRVRRVELLLGCLLLVHHRVLERVGLWDESFFMYHEEVDFLFRARNAGFPAYYCPFVRAFHQGAHSTRDQPLRKTYWLRRNTVYFFRKHRAGVAQWLHFALTLLASLAYNLLSFRWKRAGAISRGCLDGFGMVIHHD
ncbi:MAG: glycosyltransferase family 2 protein [Acidobacteriota bacterium]